MAAAVVVVVVYRYGEGNDLGRVGLSATELSSSELEQGESTLPRLLWDSRLAYLSATM